MGLRFKCKGIKDRIEEKVVKTFPNYLLKVLNNGTQS
jgi:hypothetical protein